MACQAPTPAPGLVWWWWKPIAAPRPSGFGFAVACDPADPLRAWFVPAQGRHGAVSGGRRDVCHPHRRWRLDVPAARRRLPQQHAYQLVYRHALDVDGSGTTLALASTTGSLWVSSDAGLRWQSVSHDLPLVAALRFAR